MSDNALQKITENTLLPMLQPKMNDLIALIGEMNLKRETSFALQAVNSNEYLSQATPQSVAKCVWNLAITGLSLNPIHKLAYLTPRRINNQVEAILMPSYQGLVKLITDTGSVKNVYAHPVWAGDEFEVVFGTEYSISHKPKFRGSKNEQLTHVYAVAILNDGSKQIEVMSFEEVNAIRERSDGYRAFKSGKAKSAIWETDYAEMARKTVVKRITKYLPKSDKWEALNEAIDLDNSDYPANAGQYGYIESLLSTSHYDERQRKFITDKLSEGITKSEADKIIHDLQLNQLEPIANGNNYGSKDIQNKIGTTEE